MLNAPSTATVYAELTMVDFFSLALTHVLMALAAWRLLTRDDLDRDGAAPDPEAPAPSSDEFAVPKLAPRQPLSVRRGRA